MYKTIFLAATIASPLLLTATANAESITVNAKSGVATTIYYFGSYNPRTCASSAPSKVSLRQPKNGKLTAKRVRQKVSKGRPCAGRRIQQMRVQYRSKPGFRGTDNVKFGFNWAHDLGGSQVRYYGVTGKIHVK